MVLRVFHVKQPLDNAIAQQHQLQINVTVPMVFIGIIQNPVVVSSMHHYIYLKVLFSLFVVVQNPINAGCATGLDYQCKTSVGLICSGSTCICHLYSSICVLILNLIKYNPFLIFLF